jgi:hypothetical protein
MAKSTGAALVPIPKQVERAGKTFTQNYWVKPDAVRDQLTEKGWDASDPGSYVSMSAFSQTVAALGGDADLAKFISKDWAGSCKSSLAAQLQGALGKLLGREVEDIPGAASSTDTSSNVKKGFNLPADQAEKWKKTIAATYAITQAALVKEPAMMELARGVTGPQAKAVVEFAKALADQGIHYDDAKLEVNFNSLSCFSASDEVAAGFGHASGSGVVFRMQVPKEAILFTHKASPGLADNHPSEKEHSVMCAGPTEVKMQNIAGKAGSEIHAYFASKGLTGSGEGKKLEPASKPLPTISFQVKSSDPALKAHIEGAGGKVTTPWTSRALTSPATVELTGTHEHVEKFVAEFSKTSSFDPKTNSADGMKTWLKGKADNANQPTQSTGYHNSEWVAPPPVKLSAGLEPAATATSVAHVEAAVGKTPANEQGQYTAKSYKDKWKSWAMKELGYQANKKNLAPAEQAIVDKAMQATKGELETHGERAAHGKKFSEAEVKSELKHQVHIAKVTEGHTSARDAEWKAGFQEAAEALHEEGIHPSPGSVAKMEELHGKAPPYRKLWNEVAKAALKKAGVPASEHAAAYEAATKDAKVVLAKKLLKGQKLSQKGVLATVKLLAKKHAGVP